MKLKHTKPLSYIKIVATYLRPNELSQLHGLGESLLVKGKWTDIEDKNGDIYWLSQKLGSSK